MKNPKNASETGGWPKVILTWWDEQGPQKISQCGKAQDVRSGYGLRARPLCKGSQQVKLVQDDSELSGGDPGALGPNSKPAARFEETVVAAVKATTLWL